MEKTCTPLPDYILNNNGKRNRAQLLFGNLDTPELHENISPKELLPTMLFVFFCIMMLVYLVKRVFDK